MSMRIIHRSILPILVDTKKNFIMTIEVLKGCLNTSILLAAYILILSCASCVTCTDIVPTDGAARSDGAPNRVNCAFVDVAQLRCTKEEHINVTQIGSLRLPNAMIIGASKTGTTALSALLQSHPDVKVGMGPEGDYETDFLLPSRPHDNLHRFHIAKSKTTLQQYSQAYFGGLLKKEYVAREKIIVDKVPAYSSHPLTPYMAKLVFTQSNPKFIFTVRDPIAADMSLYSYRGWSGKMKLGYDEFVVPRMKIFKKWWECREQTFNKLLMAGVHSNQQANYVTTRDLYDPNVFTWETTQMIEQEIYEKCDGMGNSGNPDGQFPIYDDFYQERLYAINLRRWVQVYGEGSVLCFTSEDFMYHQQQIKSMVATHLGIDPELFVIRNRSRYIDSSLFLHTSSSSSSSSSLSVPSFSSSSITASPDVFETDFNRTYAKTLKTTISLKEKQGTLDWALGEVRKMIDSVTPKEDREYIQRMCKRNYDDMPE